jgi:hypothetical protein
MGWMYSTVLKRDVWVVQVMHISIEDAPYFSKVLYWNDRSMRWGKDDLDKFEPPRKH